MTEQRQCQNTQYTFEFYKAEHLVSYLPLSAPVAAERNDQSLDQINMTPKILWHDIKQPFVTFHLDILVLPTYQVTIYFQNKKQVWGETTTLKAAHPFSSTYSGSGSGSAPEFPPSWMCREHFQRQAHRGSTSSSNFQHKIAVTLLQALSRCPSSQPCLYML